MRMSRGVIFVNKQLKDQNSLVIITYCSLFQSPFFRLSSFLPPPNPSDLYLCLLLLKHLFLFQNMLTEVALLLPLRHWGDALAALPCPTSWTAGITCNTLPLLPPRAPRSPGIHSRTRLKVEAPEAGSDSNVRPSVFAFSFFLPSQAIKMSVNE